MHTRGSLYTISGPSGAGKSSLVKALLHRISHLQISVSYTTRTPRPGEKDGVDYHFIKQEDFARMKKQNIFLECAEVYGNHYGSSALWVHETLDSGDDVLMEIDWQGARQVRERTEESVSIFLLPPGQDELRVRLGDRGQDDQDSIRKRMESSVREMEHFEHADYLVINRDFEQALQDLQSILRARRLRCAYNRQTEQKLIRELTSQSARN